MAKQKKKNTLKYLIIGAIILIIIAIAGSKLGWFGNGDKIQIATEKVQKRTITETVSASGKVQPETEVKLSSEVSGEIVELAIKEGDVVKKGQLLCKIRPDILESGYNRTVASLNTQKATLASAQQQLKQAEANFKNTEASYKRSEELFKKKVLSAAEYDAAQAQYLSAKANLEGLRQNIIGSKYGVAQSEAVVKEAADNLARTTIYAPVDGVVSKLSVELGERVVGTAQMAGTEIMRLANLNTMEVNVDVNENDINRVSLNDPAEIEVDAFQGRKFKGTVTEIASSANVAGTSADQVTNFTVKVRILPESYTALLRPNDKNQSPFRPGLSATVDIHTEVASGLSVPIQSVTTRDEKKEEPEKNKSNSEKKTKAAEKVPVKECVFVYQADGIVKQVIVKTGIQNDTYIQVLSGLKEGEEVVSGPFTAISKTLKDGAKVEKVSKDKLFEGDKK
ncbi:efflux RND transporter periplasmic adaptor subunit [Pararcticibacter amylolyticus]|uniref:Efflux RND transporter periplasmic adaptor subunit n=1 Tax=Pararcticibacter amylolyticus TaxID=2173175 RepID=A0A2U2PAL5_9SPHI|nr:efflux RND transporter periplasmic adaptor subunit [Pararcticibacter amylolyticus]PWG78436.1 efflux RND transporter periplasmic adaptor subunit [Pararcticibacter amylolyticus]